jgi:hypothetical protein
MRWFGRALALLLLLALGAWLARLASDEHWLTGTSVSGLSPALMRLAQRGTAYPLATDAWLEFPLLPGGGRLRILTNAQVSMAEAAATADAGLGEREEWTYTVALRLLDRQDRVLARETLILKSRIGLLERADGSLVRAIHQAPGTDAVADGRLVFIADPGQAAERLQLQLLPLSAPLTGVVARAYQREPIPERELRYRWQRQSEEARERLADSSVHGRAGIGEAERRNLLRSRWLPLAPAGVLGRDYRRLTLYQLGAEVGVPLGDPVEPPGVLAGPGQDAVVPIPAPGGQVRVRMTPVASNPAGAGAASGAPREHGGEVTLEWIGRPATRRASWREPLTRDFVAELAPGLLVISPSEPVAVRLWLTTADLPEAREITPEPSYLRAWEVGPKGALRFRVAHQGTAATPWRLNLWRLQRAVAGENTLAGDIASDPAPAPEAGMRQPGADPDPALMPYRVDLQWLDAQGELLRADQLVGALPRSRLERLPREPDTAISDAETRYFRLPPQVASLVLTSAEPVAVSAATRPPGLARELVAPLPEPLPDLLADRLADRLAESLAEPMSATQPRPDWFLLRPPDWQERRRAGSSVLLVRQPRPPVLDPRLLAGDFRFESLRPEGRWRARHLLMPAADSPFRAESLASRFVPLPLGRPQRLDFASLSGPVEPSLLYLSDASQADAAPRLSARIDDQPPIERRPRARSGLISLPPLSPGRHRVAVEASAGVRVMINHTREAFEPARAVWSRRLGLRLDQEGLTIPFTKPGPGEEVLSLRLFGFRGAPGPQRLRARLWDANGQALALPSWVPFPDWTFAEQDLRLGPAADGAVVVMQAPDEQLDAGTLAFIPLGADLAAGDYRLRLDLLDGPGGYVTLTLTEPGAYPWARFRHDLD